ncbi:MAG: ABC transporter permease, partial [Acholeplasmataceae bacterium]|nr:ABC transporter permease [Acholeplasmataceae bacterium]
MFFALKELKYAKAKFALITSVIVLVGYLVYFLTSLAYGLASSYTNAVNKWGANEIILTVESNDNMMMSYMTQDDYDSVAIDGAKAKIGLFPAVINNPVADNVLESRVDVYFFGIEDSFLKPSELSNLSLNGNKVIVDEELKKEGYKVGDLFGATGTENKYEIIGFSTKSTYQTAPVVYMNLTTWKEYRYGLNSAQAPFSGVIVRGKVTQLSDKLLSYSVDSYIATLPGYTAQVLTFSTMIGFLIIIVAFV